MGAIEPLLGIVQMKKASGLWLAAGHVPALLFAGERRPLTMPAIGVEMFQTLLEELLPPESRAELEGSAGKVEASFTSSTGFFLVRARIDGAMRSVTLTKGAQPAPGAAVSLPPAAAGLAPAMPATAAPAHAVPEPASSAPALPPLASSAAASQGTDPASLRMEQALTTAAARGASDVLFTSAGLPFARVRGELRELEDAGVFQAADLLAFTEARLGPGRRALFEQAGSVDFAFTVPTARGREQRFRANLFQHAGGLALAARPIWTEVPGLRELGLPPSLTDVVAPTSGLVLIAGATGAGKSTTLATLLDHVSNTRACHIVTLEDPVEYLFQRRRALVHQREVGRHVESFASGLRSALRENPDILVVGEMRDAETIRLALTAAETGHLVLSTVHGANAAMALERILDAFAGEEKQPAQHQLAGALRFVVAQALLPGSDGGRIPVVEILSATYAVSALVREGRMHMLSTQLETGGEHGMLPMERSLVELVRAGRVTRAAALAAAPNREALLPLLDDGRARRKP